MNFLKFFKREKTTVPVERIMPWPPGIKTFENIRKAQEIINKWNTDTISTNSTVDYVDVELYKNIISFMPIACVDIAIISNGRVLLVNRKDAPARGLWWLPGGRVIKGETMKETALRKARDEVGIDCHIGPIIHTAETIFPDGPYNIPVHSINSCFLLYPISSNQIPNLDSHHDNYVWVSKIYGEFHNYVKNCLIGAGFHE